MISSFPLPEADADDRAEEVYIQALRLPAGERAAFVGDACADDDRLRHEVMGLLDAHERAGSFLTDTARLSPTLAAEFARLTPESPGQQIGPYVLRELIGEGGFGTVWVADQESPVRRRVALKIIKPGMDTREVIARFEQERQALAMMDHPNIARVLDAGATELGRPFFVMELVRGTRITEYCDQAQLSTADRLRLFISVCNAVQHAHQKGIIHRDLKPSNILVTLHDGVPVPKVIDFGVAKATHPGRLTDLTIYTQLEQMVGTPLYMSPEQMEMSGLDIDTRSDIYALGVLLYELLAGRTPFDPQTLMQRGVDEIRRVVREVEPPMPSTFVSTLGADRRTDLARRRQTDGARLTAQIRGDLDWIVMKALEKDRTRRYDTATGLARDLERHLACEPVEARPPSRWYRFQRFAKRHTTTLVAGSAVALALVIGLAATTWMYLKERDARERAATAEQEQTRLRLSAESQGRLAATEATRSHQAVRFLKQMLRGIGPSVALGRDTVLLREILGQAEQRLGEDLQGQSDVEAEMRGVIADVYQAMGDYSKAAPLIEQALELTKASRGAETEEYALLLEDKAVTLSELGRLAEAESVQREVLALNRRLFGPVHPMVATSMNNLALLLGDLGQWDDALALHREELALSRSLYGDDHSAVATSLANLGSTLQNLGSLRLDEAKLREAESVLRESLALRRRLLGDEHPDVAITLNNLANTVQGLGELDESAALFRETLALQRRFLGNHHPNVATALNGLALALHKLGRDAEAEPLMQEAVEIEKIVRAGPHPQTARLLGNLARVMAAQGKSGEAEAAYREAIAIYNQLPGPEHADVPSWRHRLSMVLESQGKHAEAEVVLGENLAALRRAATPGTPDPNVASALFFLATSFVAQGKYAEAEPCFREIIEINRQLGRDGTSEFRTHLDNHELCLERLHDTLCRHGKFTDAESLLLERIQARENDQKLDPRFARAAITRLVRLYDVWDKPEAAAHWRERLERFDQ